MTESISDFLEQMLFLQHDTTHSYQSLSQNTGFITHYGSQDREICDILVVFKNRRKVG